MSWKAWQWIVLAAFLLLCLAVGGIAGYWTAPAVAGWYRQIVKPSWTPPDWLFGPVWTTLYILIGVAGWQVWRSRNSPARNRALMIWSVKSFFSIYESAKNQPLDGLFRPGLLTAGPTGVYLALVQSRRMADCRASGLEIGRIL